MCTAATSYESTAPQHRILTPVAFGEPSNDPLVSFHFDEERHREENNGATNEINEAPVINVKAKRRAERGSVPSKDGPFKSGFLNILENCEELNGGKLNEPLTKVECGRKAVNVLQPSVRIP